MPYFSFKEGKNNDQVLTSDTKSLNEPLMAILLSYSPTWIPHLQGHNDHLMKVFISDIDIHDDILNVSVESNENCMDMSGCREVLWVYFGIFKSLETR